METFLKFISFVLIVFLLTVALFLFTLRIAQANIIAVHADCDTTISYQVYTACYSNKYRGSVFSSYVVTPAMINADVIKDRPSFTIEKLIDKAHRSSVRDYSRTGYDIGHLAPNSALNFNENAQKQTFKLSNGLPQKSNLNRVLWRKIEASVRKLAETKIVGVTTGACFPDNPDTIGKNRLSIPKAFFKFVQYDEEYLLYYAENIDHENKPDINNYLISIESFNVLCDTVEIR